MSAGRIIDVSYRGAEQWGDKGIISQPSSFKLTQSAEILQLQDPSSDFTSFAFT